MTRLLTVEIVSYGTGGWWGRGKIQLSFSRMVCMYSFLPFLISRLYLCKCEWLPGACLCQGARHPPTLPTFVASQSIPVTKEASNLTLTSQWTYIALPSMSLFSVGNYWRGAIGHSINFKYSLTIIVMGFLLFWLLDLPTESPKY